MVKTGFDASPSGGGKRLAMSWEGALLLRSSETARTFLTLPLGLAMMQRILS